MKRNWYAITVEGRLGNAARLAFEGLEVTESHGDRTTLTGELDQSGLYGILLRGQALALELVDVRRVADAQAG